MKAAQSIWLICLGSLLWSPLQAQDPDSLMDAAEKEFMEQRYEPALVRCRDILAMPGADSVSRSLAFAYAGLCSEELGDPASALDYYREALLLDVPRLSIYDQMIGLAREQEDDPAYEFALLRKKEAFPDFEIAVVQSLAFHYFNTKQYGKLLECTRQLTGWFPDNTRFHYFDATAKQRLGDTQGAEKSFKTVLELEPDHAGANMGLGMILYNRATKLFEKAIEEYEAIKNPDRVDYYNYNKKIEVPQAIYRQAIPYLLKAYENPSYSGLRAALYNSYMRLEDMDNANKYKE